VPSSDRIAVQEPLMPLLLTCSGCGAKLRAPGHEGGGSWTCPRCLVEVRTEGVQVEPTQPHPAAASEATNPGDVRFPDVDRERRREGQATGWALIAFALLGLVGLVPLLLLLVALLQAPKEGFLPSDPLRAVGLVGCLLLAGTLVTIACVVVSRQKRQGETPSGTGVVLRTLAFLGFVLWSVAGLFAVGGMLFMALFEASQGPEPLLWIAVCVLVTIVLFVVWCKLSEAYLRIRFPEWISRYFGLRALAVLGVALVITLASALLVLVTCTAGAVLGRMR
jgi:hypothetical protein